ncbi:DUF397 domain-containing protein [Streptomyces sp. NPDC048290]|uniref:DUF397 domain-containing protein n=1 Tax=Streptomyces sp. NPDC048290 TaxID=3155811 RepID=UPI0034325418
MFRTDLPADGWKKSSHSDGGNAQCVETLPLTGPATAVRDSKAPAHGAFVFPVATWAAFLDGVKRGLV